MVFIFISFWSFIHLIDWQRLSGTTLPSVSKIWLEMGLLCQHSMVYETYKFNFHSWALKCFYIFIRHRYSDCNKEKVINVSWIIFKVIVLAQRNIQSLLHLPYQEFDLANRKKSEKELAFCRRFLTLKGCLSPHMTPTKCRRWSIRQYLITSDNFAPSLKFELNHPSLPPYPQSYL